MNEHVYPYTQYSKFNDVGELLSVYIHIYTYIYVLVFKFPPPDPFASEHCMSLTTYILP